MKQLRATLVLLFFILFWPLQAISHQDPATAIARQTAEEYLHLLDRSEFELAWAQTSLINQSYVEPPEWFKKLLAVRPHLGQVVSRQVKTTSQHSGWVGLPDGEYFRISFASNFLSKQDALETLVLVKEGGHWMISSYHLR